jgi:hypothetical protein
MYKKVDRLCGLVVRVPGYTTEMYCASCEVRTEFIYVMYKNENRDYGRGDSLTGTLTTRPQRQSLCTVTFTI